MTPTTITLQGLDVRFGAAQALVAVDATLSSGTVGLLGANGAGKSTLLGVLSGMIKPTSGTADLSGYSGMRGIGGWREKLGVMPQHFDAPPRFTVRECFEYAAWLKRMPRHEIAQAVESAASLARVTDHLDARISQLSGGMKQRVGIGCSIVNRPRVLLLDEPANGLDIEQRSLFREVVRSLHGDALVIISSHHAEDIATICDRILILNEGSLVHDGPIGPFVGKAADAEVSGAELEVAYLTCLAIARERSLV